MRNKPGEKRNMPVPQGMSKAMPLAGVKARIGKNDLPDVFNCRVVSKNCLNISPDVFNKQHLTSNPKVL
jgi:hypothetical protein